MSRIFIYIVTAQTLIFENANFIELSEMGKIHVNIIYSQIGWKYMTLYIAVIKTED